MTARSTHLVSLEPLRTVNFLRGIIRGLWILRYEWIVESLAAGRWLPEEPFEVRDFSAAVSVRTLTNARSDFYRKSYDLCWFVCRFAVLNANRSAIATK